MRLFVYACLSGAIFFLFVASPAPASMQGASDRTTLVVSWPTDIAMGEREKYDRDRRDRGYNERRYGREGYDRSYGDRDYDRDRDMRRDRERGEFEEMRNRGDRGESMYDRENGRFNPRGNQREER